MSLILTLQQKGAVNKQHPLTITDLCKHAFIDDFSSEASYCAVLFISPRIRCSKEPESAPFRAITKSYNTNSVRLFGTLTHKIFIHISVLHKGKIIHFLIDSPQFLYYIIMVCTFFARFSYSNAISLLCEQQRFVRMSMIVCSSTPEWINEARMRGEDMD